MCHIIGLIGHLNHLSFLFNSGLDTSIITRKGDCAISTYYTTRIAGNVVNLRTILSYGKKITVRKYLKNQSNYDSSILLPYFDLRCAMNSVQIVSSILQAANNKLVSKEFQEKYRIGNSFSRSRKLSFSTLIYFILQSVPKSIPINYSQLLDS